MRKRRGYLWALGLAGALLSGSAPYSDIKDDEVLKIEGSVLPKKLSSGEEGKVILKLEVHEGIFLSVQPSFIIEFTPVPELIFPKNFFTASDLNLEVVEDKGENYLVLRKPIEIPFTVSLDAKRGGHILEGRIKYFARCPEEGWCYKASSKFSLIFSTRQTVFKKKTG